MNIRKLNSPLTLLTGLTIILFLVLMNFAPGKSSHPANSTLQYETDIKDLKHYYSRLSGINTILLDHYKRNDIVVSNSEFQDTSQSILKDIHIAINNIKSLSYNLDSMESIDISALIALLDKYAASVEKTLEIPIENKSLAIELLQKDYQYFTLINSEYFYITDEIERAQWELFNQALLDTKSTIYILEFIVVLLICFGFIYLLHQNVKPQKERQESV